MHKLTSIALPLLATACANAAGAGAGPVPISQASSEADFELARAARYSVEVYSGRGLPGSPGADQYIADYLTVLQDVVDTCALGETVLVQATDGVSILAITDNDLSENQVACIRGKERPGLSLRDRGERP